MEVREAQAFLVLAEELHFGHAAKRLHMAQPPLSRMIKQLETTLGAELFARSTRHVALTPAGSALVDPARELVAAADRAEQAVRDAASGRTGRIAVGFSGTSFQRGVGTLARELARTHPGIELNLHSGRLSPEGIGQVTEGTLDATFGRWDTWPTEIDSLVVAREELLVALPDDHRLAGQDDIDFAELAAENWIVLPGGLSAGLQNRLNYQARSAGFTAQVGQVAPDSMTQFLFVGAGMGVALTLDSIRENLTAHGVSFSRLPGRPTLDLRLVWRRDNRSQALKVFVDLARELYASPTAH
ncbi:LysR family transcriptional regulator [Corynebacterium frankenforstense DSM 45800]|uniref:LysR family transcriptional regulator n=1 Tax=Corynebacterium frankenforstense DSM 45800 TaxID=1437875 RepID=A0A1L7CQ89_9CORY|nr:LysR substrate-binding domain-containing protein [Corynebacterium frankenforstense]APT88026.1 LysR family transcriptional regulator [Corynebacterium frankenforstense DSM 45800]